MAKPKTIDEYIATAEGTFAHPILLKVREVVHQACPVIEEAIKWGAPSFEHKGLMMSMVKFKNNVAVWFHMGALLIDPKNLLESSSEKTKAMRKYIIPTIDDLDESGLYELILEAVAIQDSGKQVEGFNQSGEEKHSDLLTDALKNDPLALEKFEEFAAYKKKEFIEHIESAKRDDTKQRRLEQSLEMIWKGIGLHDKYRN